MTANLLIARLNVLIEEHGDVEMTVNVGGKEYLLPELEYAAGETRFGYGGGMKQPFPRFMLEAADLIAYRDEK